MHRDYKVPCSHAQATKRGTRVESVGTTITSGWGGTGRFFEEVERRHIPLAPPPPPGVALQDVCVASVARPVEPR
jgi:hypothetical protein